MIWFIGTSRCYEREARKRGLTRDDLGKKIFLVMRSTLKGRRWQDGDELVTCDHCVQEWKWSSEDWRSYINLTEWIERLQAGVPHVHGKNNGV